MWSIPLLVNKLLKAVEENFDGSSGNHFNFVDSYTIQQSSNKDQCTNLVLSHFVEVPHINQQHTWDCGLACVLMVLRTLGAYDCNIQELVKLCCTTSIWTVDLAYLLQKFSVSFTYCTVTLGANPDFSVETFYKDQLPTDLVRVNMLFQEAREAGIHIECRSISIKEVSDLVDQHKLSPLQLEDICVPDFYGGSPGYTGKNDSPVCLYSASDATQSYNLLAFARAETFIFKESQVITYAVMDEFEIRDPASSRKHERVSSWCLDQAHKSFGTDEDLLLISLEKDLPCKVVLDRD